MRTTRGTAFRVALACAALTVPLAVADVAAAAETGRPPAIAWSPCPEDPTAQCGTLRVPIDWSRPDGPAFDLALARRPATDPAARIGTLQVNPGGPGGSGRLLAIHGADSFSPELRRRFDIIGIDPRGVGLSSPIRCSLALLEQEPPFQMTSQADFDARVAYNARLRADCRARSGPLFDHVDMRSVARDMDYVRAALGDPKLSYLGVSYGSMNAQHYAELFPHRVRAIVSDSNLDHSLGTRGWLDTEAASTQDSFNEFVKWNERTPTSPLYGQDARAIWQDLLARAERGELPFPPDPTRPLRPEELIGFAFGAFYGPDWFILAEELLALHTGTPIPTDPATTRAFLAGAGSAASAASAAAADEEVVDFPGLAIFCSDWHLPVRDYREWTSHLRRLAQIAPDMRYGPPATGLTAACLGTPTPIANPQHQLRVRDLDTPVLVVNARHDPATGYNRALGVARQLGRDGVLLTYDGWGHGVYGRSACVTDTIDRHLVTRQPPPRGTHCPAVEPPAPEARTLTTWSPTTPY
ncbi:alpha/beta hydrolase [Actinomycetes bacterium KLBMP 9797]